jgi:glycine/D-amino acid oxidase-like deaminating enzyme
MVKVAPHGHTDKNVFSHPSQRKGTPDPSYVTQTTEFARKLFPDTLVQQDGAGGLELERDTCLYSVTRDANFVIDWVSPRCLVLAGFSGSGFKHTPLIGKIASEMIGALLSDPLSAAVHAPPSYPRISRFSIKRSSLLGDNAASRLAQEHQAVARSSL